jgi:SH3 domain-containing YSC84-like protein 1
MRLTTLKVLTIAMLGLTMSLSVQAQDKDKKESSIKDQIEQSQKAATVFTEIMNTPDKGIPQDLLGKAKCVAVFPNVLKGGFVVGGRGGRGVASCRNASGWSAPAYFNLGGGSIGLQIGVQSTDFVLLVMNEKGMNSLLSDKFSVGGDASAAAGPVGRQAGAATDVKLNAEILSYSRSKGLFAGLELQGAVISPDKDDIREVYGSGATAKTILNGGAKTPVSVKAFPDALAKYSAVNSASK